ncbi:MAG: hypothetical protein GC155_00225 [Alphaproteobacteria bacterium]|nr:hypothetical protein [Alphaproteobacteria bacterium]
MRAILLGAVLAVAFSGPAEAQRDPLSLLLAEPKFERTLLYAGADTPEDKPRLLAIVNGAIADVRGLPIPRDPELVRSRLARGIAELDTFATEDRDRGDWYLLRAWRASGFRVESGLFEVPDQRILSLH